MTKNYLQEKEIRQLERTVTAYFDYIEGLVERRNTFTMRGLADSIDRFLFLMNMKSYKEKEVFPRNKQTQKLSRSMKNLTELKKSCQILINIL